MIAVYIFALLAALLFRRLGFCRFRGCVAGFCLVGLARDQMAELAFSSKKMLLGVHILLRCSLDSLELIEV